MRHWKRAQPLPQKDVQVLFAPQVPWHSKIVLLLAGLQDSPLAFCAVQMPPPAVLLVRSQ